MSDFGGNITNSDDERDRGQRFMQEYSRIQRRLYGFVVSLVPDFSMADDIVQDTVSVMWLKFDEFEPGTDFCAWAFKIARYRVLYYRRCKLDMKNRFSDQTLEHLSEAAESASPQMDCQREMLKKCLRKLTSNEREILHLRYEEGASVKKVAAFTNLNVNTLYKMLSRIHLSLLNCIQTKMRQEGLL
jgi:RNA polymerase sigma-70 factor (ECF subfamily)